MLRFNIRRRADRADEGSCRSGEQGVVLLWASISIIIIAGVIVSGTDDLRAVDAVTRADFAARGQVIEVAQAGLVDAFAWMRRQTVQPVDTFAPRLDLNAATTINETDDPTRGLIRTFEISPSLWGRYEVLKGIPAEAFTDADGNGHYDSGEAFTDTNGDGRWTGAQHTRDVSVERGMAGTGGVWLLESRATIFRRPRGDLPLGAGPNTRVATATMATEVRRLTINPPAEAAICVKQANRVNIGSRARVRADVTAVAWAGSTGAAQLGGAEILASTTAVPGYASDIEDVFGVSWTELKSMADISTSDAVSGVPAKLADYSLVVVTGDISFTNARPLRGLGVVVVQGNCNIEPGSNSFFNGLLYVSGNLTARAPAYLRGTIIVDGDLDMTGTGGDYCEVEHDPALISDLLTRMGQYRYSKAPFLPSPRLSDGRPTELGLSKRRFGTGYATAGGGGAGGGTTGGGTTGGGTTGGGTTGGTGGGSGTAPPPDPTPTGFDPQGLRDALQAFLEQNPAADGTGLMLEAIDKLDLAKVRMAQTPPNAKGAVGAVKQAIIKLTDAIATGVDPAAFSNELYGDDQTLYPQIRDMVNTMITDSTAPAAALALATDKYNTAVAKMDRARDRMNAGNTTGAMADYKNSAGRFRAAIDAIDQYQ